jgi:hypothetical protein
MPDQSKTYVVLVRWGLFSRTLEVPGDILQRFVFAGRVTHHSEGYYETTSRFIDFVTLLRRQEGLYASVDGS